VLNSVAFLASIVLAAVMVLYSVVYIRKTIKELKYVPPYQGFAIAFFVNLVLFTIVCVAYFTLYGLFSLKYIHGPYQYTSNSSNDSYDA